jgi:DNA-binding GntR family transcriptional regulator
MGKDQVQPVFPLVLAISLMVRKAMTRISALGGIHRRYLHDEIADRLRALILTGELEPRSRINEIELCELFGTSRTPLREAIKILSSEGLLELLPNRGAHVSVLSGSEIDDMIQVIAGLEVVAAELACQRITDDEILTIAEDTQSMEEAWRKRDEPGYFMLNRAIHEAIMSASGNETLKSVYANLSSRIQRMRYTAHKTEVQWKQAVNEHSEMVILLRARKGEELAQLMKRHIRSKAAVIAASYGKDAAQ